MLVSAMGFLASMPLHITMGMRRDVFARKIIDYTSNLWVTHLCASRCIDMFKERCHRNVCGHLQRYVQTPD